MAAFNTRAGRQAEAFITYIVVKTMPEMLQKLILKEVNPKFICTSYLHYKDKYKKALKLSEKEQQTISNLHTVGFRKCDTPLLYKLCQYYECVSAPSEGWGKFNNQIQNIGDAVEAIVRLRHEIIRNPTQDFKERRDRMIQIAELIDKEISAPEKFEESVKSLCVDNFDDRCIEKCKTTFQQITEEANGSFEDDVLEEDEPISFDEDYNTNVWKKQIVLSTALFEKTRTDPQAEIESIKKKTDKLCKQGASRGKDVLPGTKRSLRSRKRKSTLDQTDQPSLSSESEGDIGYNSSLLICSGN